MTQDSSTPAQESPHKGRRDWWKPVLLVIVIIALFAVANYSGVGTQLAEIQQWMPTLGIWGPVVFFLIYIALVLLTFPGIILGPLAGLLFGSVDGIILISIASTVGAALAFLIARYFARDAVARWLSKSQTMRRLDDLTEKQGVFIVAITRLVPLFPFTLLNYGFGLTKVSFKTYLFWSWLCMLPWTIVFVASGDASLQWLSKGTIPWILIGIIILTIVCLEILIWYTRRHVIKKE
ncbi:MAG TPA: TVP38/TMEM64 family protein [Candidatus Thermoplasmatota archaeon]|nr:TVP38/TMEM64 family protein [Candidatus Thermoplasmatota archaeon]